MYPTKHHKTMLKIYLLQNAPRSHFLLFLAYGLIYLGEY